MPSEYVPIAVLIIFATATGFLIVGLGHLIGPRRPSVRKAEAYESGMRPIGPGRRRLPVHFYLVAVLFILFDIEIVFLLPWAVVLRQFKILAIVEMVIFILVLLVGYVYAWKKGALTWE